jgi:hypothetical protein
MPESRSTAASSQQFNSTIKGDLPSLPSDAKAKNSQKC